MKRITLDLTSLKEAARGPGGTVSQEFPQGVFVEAMPDAVVYTSVYGNQVAYFSHVREPGETDQGAWVIPRVVISYFNASAPRYRPRRRILQTTGEEIKPFHPIFLTDDGKSSTIRLTLADADSLDFAPFDANLAVRTQVATMYDIAQRARVKIGVQTATKRSTH